MKTRQTKYNLSSTMTGKVVMRNGDTCKFENGDEVPTIISRGFIDYHEYNKAKKEEVKEYMKNAMIYLSAALVFLLSAIASYLYFSKDMSNAGTFSMFFSVSFFLFVFSYSSMWFCENFKKALEASNDITN